MLVDKQNELMIMSDLLFTVHQHGGDDVTWKPPIEHDDTHYQLFWNIMQVCQFLEFLL